MNPFVAIAQAIVKLFSFLKSPAPQPAPSPKPEPKPEPKPTPSPAPRDPPWMVASAVEIGVTETPGPKSTPRIMDYRRFAGCDLDGDDGAVPWCRIYICAIFASCGIPYKKDWMARAVERDPNFIELPGPALDAVCSFWRSSKASGLGHTGFYRGETKTKVLVEGGNESDAVRRQFSLKANLVGYYWPKGYRLPKIGEIWVDDDGKPIGSVV
jgi:uncharacterized protein (TIGR02594 family)